MMPKRYIATCFLAGLLVALAAASSARESVFNETFAKANAAYDEGDYATAIELYEELIDESVVHSAVFHNLGNAYYRAGYLGPAIANFERALELDPNAAHARDNLAKCVRETQRKLARPAPAEWKRSLLFWHYALSPRASRRLAIWCWLALWVLLAFGQVRPVPRLGRWAFLAGVLALALGGSAWVKAHGDLRAVANDAKVPVHYGTDEDETVRFELFAGDRVVVDRRTDGWARVTTADGERGWAKAGSLTIVGPLYERPNLPGWTGGWSRDAMTTALPDSEQRSRFEELVAMASQGDKDFAGIPRHECAAAAGEFVRNRWEGIRRRHEAGESGANIVRMLSDSADAALRGVFEMALFGVHNRRYVLSRVSFCALGGYGRAELSPYSDLDVCMLYEGELDDHIKELNDFLVPFLWDMGFAVGYAIRDVSEAMELAREEVQALTSFLEGRLITGQNTAFARLKLSARDWISTDRSNMFIQLRVRERNEALPEEYRDLYRPDPNVKESAGGLRDLHTAQWLLTMACGASTLDDVASQGLVRGEDHLAVVEAQDFIWRIRNELHYHAGRAEDRLTFENQKHVAQALNYGADQQGVARLMEDYYAAARRLRRFLHLCVDICDHRVDLGVGDAEPDVPDYAVHNGRLYVGQGDTRWFEENPVRLMEVFWECARNGVRLSRPTARLVSANLALIGDTFRDSDMVRRFFAALCDRPLQAGSALRQMASAGVLSRYIPEFAAIQGVIRYEDFHHYPVDEHTLRAVEALAELDNMSGPVAQCLQVALEDLYNPRVLVMAILFHDLGKAAGEVHVEEGVRLVHQFCKRTGVHEDDEERIAFLVEHHMLMTTISMYRDTDDEETIRRFAETVKTSDRLRALFLLSYCDLYAVGPGVWNDWKGTLLMKLYLRAEKLLEGGSRSVGVAFWESSKAQAARALLSPELEPHFEEHLRALDERYFVAFTPEEMALHLGCVLDAKETGFAVYCSTDKGAGMSRVVVCTKDRPGLFSKIAGCFASQLVDVNSAALFTRPDGYVVDCFVVADATRQRALTRAERAGIETVLERVLVGNDDVQELVEHSRRRLFALLQPRIPVPTRIDFDDKSSRTHTVIDIRTADRTGLLYDIARAMVDGGLDISTARIVTDVRHVRDSFYVTCEGEKINEEEQQAAVRTLLHAAIHPGAAAERR